MWFDTRRNSGERPGHGKVVARSCFVLLALALVAVSGLAVKRNPDSRVDRPPNAQTVISEVRNPAIALDGSRVYAVFMDRRYGTQYDPSFNVSVNEAATWRRADVRLNTNFPPGFGDGGGMEFVYPAAGPAEHLYVLMQDDIFGTLYIHTSPDRGETWPGNPQKMTLNEANPVNPWFTVNSTITALGPSRAAIVWSDMKENSIGGHGNVRVRITSDGGVTWLPEQQVNIGDESLPYIGDEERATDVTACGDADDRLYVAWRDKGDPDPDVTGQWPGRILLRYSLDGGQTFLPADGEITLDRLDDGDPQFEAAAPDIDCRAGGTVAVAWEDERLGKTSVFVAVSTDGGATFSDEVRVDDAPEGVSAVSPRIVVAGGDPARLHVAWQDDRDGVADVYVTTSEDSGASWSPPLRLTGSAAAGGAPVEDWDLDGDGSQVSLAWIDDRSGGPDFDARDVFAVFSSDGGRTWSDEERLDVGTGAGEADSDMIDVAANDSSYVAVYRDFRNVINLGSGVRKNSDLFAGGNGMAFDPDDADADGVRIGVDNCPDYPNAPQDDDDYDGYGNLCDGFPNDPEDDADRDGLDALADNCPDVSNQLQEDSDGDGFGDACDLCLGVLDEIQRDLDGDGVGDACDSDLDGDGIVNDSDGDDDGDGVSDAADSCPTVPNPAQLDWNDFDGVGDACDRDDDTVAQVVVEPMKDGRIRAIWEPETGASAYNVYFGRAGELAAGDPGYCYRPGMELTRATLTDIPAAGEAYWYLVTPLTGGVEGSPGADSSGMERQLPAVCDASAAADWDGDGADNAFDNCPLDDNAGQADRDRDGAGDACDPYPGDPDDDALDGDGFGGDVDNCPLVPNPDQADADGDGVGDACDVCPDVYDPLQRDGDKDGVGDACEPDLDGDGVPNDLDDDLDGDGIPNAEDNCESVANPGQLDRNDGDGVGDACDVDDGEVSAVRFAAGSTVRLEWARESGAGSYAVYSDAVSTLGGGIYGECLVPSLPIPFAEIDGIPAPGTADFYLVTGFFDGGEGTGGWTSDGTERETPGGCE